MKKNFVPAVIAFAPAVLLPVIQRVLRPRIPHTSSLRFILGWAPDFVVGFCFPFSILIKPRAWTSQTAAWLFILWTVLTVVSLLVVEWLSPVGPNVFDPADLIAGVVAAALAVVTFYTYLRKQLTFGDETSPRSLR